ncbi:MAG: hypothetical protein GC178_13295 [Flavobacteriales bacterium]|nr:hypothetical protein [Flavobacteriales bacterium]
MFNSFPRFFTGVENRNEHLAKLLLSGIYFAIAFILVSYTGHFWSTNNAWTLGYRPTFSYDCMESLAGSGGWTTARIGWVYLAPPLWGLLVAIVAISAFRLVDSKQTHLRTFLFWLSLNGFLLYFSYIMTGIFSGQDYGSILFTGFVGFYSWLDLEKGPIYLLLVMQLIVSMPFGLIYSKPVLKQNYSRMLATKPNGKSVIFLNVVAVPFFIGCLLVGLTTFPMALGYQLIRMFSFLPIFIVMVLGLSLFKSKHITIVKGGLRPINRTALAILLLLLIASRFWLQVPIKPIW